MTNRLELNWKVDGFVDEQRYYGSEEPIDIENLPTPKAVFLGDVRTYVDTDIEFGKTYYVRVGSVKNGVEKVSNEIIKSAEKLLVFLPLTSDVADSGSLGLNWINDGGVTFSADGANFTAFSQSIYQNTHAFNFNNDYKLSFEIKRTSSANTYPTVFNNSASGLWQTGTVGLTFAGSSAAAIYANKMMVDNANNYDRQTNFVFSNNVYYTIELSKIAGVVRLKVNDVVDLTFTETHSSNVNAFLRIGLAVHHATNGQFIGYIRNFKIYDLSP